VAADGWALAAVGRERSARLWSASAVTRNRVQDGRIDAEDGCSSAGDGCFVAADVPKSPGARRVETNACRRLVHHGWLFAIGGGELSATGGKFERDG